MSFRSTAAICCGLVLISMLAGCARSAAPKPSTPVRITSNGNLDPEAQRTATETDALIASSDLVESKVLKTALQELAAETLQEAKQADQSIPEDVTVGKVMSMMMHEMRTLSPNFIRVSPEAERRYQQGKFDDALARQRWKKAVKTLADFDVELPQLHEKLLSDDEAAPLTGARLELAAQLFEAQVAKLTQNVTE